MNSMILTILLPGEVFAHLDNIAHIEIETSAGVMGLLPRRRDCVAALIPGILVYRQQNEHNGYVAIDHGIMVKTAVNVTLAVRRAFAGQELEELEAIIPAFYRDLDEEDKELHALFAKMESGLLRRLADIHHG